MTKAFELMLFRRKETLVKIQKAIKELEKPVPESEFLQYEPAEVAASNIIRGAIGMVVMSVNYILHLLEHSPKTVKQIETEIHARTSSMPEA